MNKMAHCPACRRQISINAEQCPKCGEPLEEGWGAKSQAETRKGCLALIILVLFLASLATLLSQ